ncbi:MAG: FAD-binding oxidoreductase [Gemmatimonadaceae bacterium]
MAADSPTIDRDMRSPIRGQFRTDPDARHVYAEGAGIARIIPFAVAEPIDAEDVVALLRWAAEEHQSLIPRGSGSSMPGGAVGSGIIVDLSRFTELGDVNVAAQSITAGAGVTRRRIEHSANAVGLRFPVDPSSGAFATIGGMASTNAAGARTLAFGATRRWIRALDCVFADGSRETVRRGAPINSMGPTLARWNEAAANVRQRAQRVATHAVRKESSGYGVRDFAESGELIDLLVGSEGTLALFTSVELSLAPMPRQTASILAAWKSLDASVVGAALARDHHAAACELLDRTFLDVAAAGGALPIPEGSEAVLLVEIEDDVDAAARARALAQAFESAGATSVQLGLDAESEESLWALRHAASPILSRLDPHLKSMQLVEDGCVPPARLGDYVRGVREALQLQRLRGVIFGHAGDAHVHVNALIDVREIDWRERARRFCEAVVELTATLGGTLAGEHGDGRLRTPWLDRVWEPSALALFADIKEIFDPRRILNPGVKVATDGADILAANKYDPSLAPLSRRAREVLDRVERERAYDSSRLELLKGVG